MSGLPENNPTNQEIAERIAAANRKSGEELAMELIRAATRAKEIKQRIDDAVEKGKEVPGAFTGQEQDKESDKGKASDTKKLVQEILLAVGGTAGKKLTPEAQAVTKPTSDFAQAALQQLGKNIRAEDVTELAAPYLWQLMTDIVQGKANDVDSLAEQFKNIKNLKTASPDTFEKVQNALIDIAKNRGNIGEQEAKQKFEAPAALPPPEPPKPTEPPKQAEPTPDDRRGRGGFDEIYSTYFGDYFDSQKDYELTKAIYDPNEFINFVGREKNNLVNKLKAEGRTDVDVNSEEVGRKVSKELEARVTELFGKLYTRLAHERPGEFFEKVEQEDVMRGILPAKNMLKRRLEVLANTLHNAKDLDLGLYQDRETRASTMDVPYHVEGDKEDHLKPRMRIHPYPKAQKTTGYEFVHYLDNMVDTYIDTLKYTYNSRAIFLHPVDPEKGFYSQLQQFSEQMTTVDMDQLSLLPDGDIFQNAMQLYDKHVQEMFAQNDWRHAATMFQPLSGSPRNQIEEDVLKQLRKQFPPEVSDARIEMALTMAVGAARGIFMVEQETASSADPHLNEDGSFTYASYYNNDTSALLPFNPMHKFWRFQGLKSTDPILFFPVEGSKFKSHTFYDHRELLKNMQSYRETYLKGREGAGLDGQVLFADFLMNVGRVGGPMWRKGWRTNAILEPLFLYDDRGYNEGEISTKVMDHHLTWKRLENIGYEVAQDFVTKLKPDFAGAYEGKSSQTPQDKEANNRYVAQKVELFKHVYARYFNDTDTIPLDEYLNQIRKVEEKNVWDHIKSGKPAPRDVKAEVEANVTTTFMNRVLARMVAQRIPSKILRIDRDRYSKGGRSRWRLMAEELFPRKQFGDQQSEYMHAVIKDLMFAEQLLRAEISEKMKTNVKNKYKESEHWRFGDIDYRLTQDFVRTKLAEKGYTETQISNACKLLGRIETLYSKNNTYLDKELLGMVKAGPVDKKDFKFTFGHEEFDMTFIPWRAAGNRMLPRIVSDIANVEKNVAGEIMKLPDLLFTMAIDGKRDFTPILDMCQKAFTSMEGIISPDYAHRLVHHIASAAITYFKKDTVARAFYGLLGMGRKNSLAAARHGGGSAVWEWNATEIDRFCTGLYARGLLPKDGFNVNNKATYLPAYLTLPFVNKTIKLPESIKIGKIEIPLFRTRKPDFDWTIKRLRDNYGANWKDFAFDYANRYLPFILAWLFWQYMKKAQEEAQGKKK